MNLQNHPYLHICEIIKTYSDAEFEFSIYEYEPRALFDKRATFKVNGSHITEKWFSSILESLKGEEELALHSKIKIGNRYYHLPMIDFSCSSNELDFAMQELRKVLDPSIFSGFKYYDSGRSMHGYGSCLLSRADWLRFMGAILLVNIPDEQYLIDSRWVGHRLIGGYSSLRWTSNTKYYLRTPTLIHL